MDQAWAGTAQRKHDLVLGPGCVTVFALRTGTIRLKSFLRFSDPNPFGTKHDRIGTGWAGLA
jgi:hypothetical protein